MRHIGHIIVAIYSIATLVLTYWPAMANTSGIQQSGPWMLAMIVAFLFFLASGFKLVRGTIEAWTAGQQDEISMAEFDFPDTYLFGMFSAFVVVNLVAHGVLAAESDAAGSIWFGAWVLGDILVLLVSFVIFKVTAKAQLQRQNRPRNINRSDAA